MPVIEVVAHGAYDKCKPHQICSANDIGAELETKQERRKTALPMGNLQVTNWHEIFNK